MSSVPGFSLATGLGTSQCYIYIWKFSYFNALVASVPGIDKFSAPVGHCAIRVTIQGIYEYLSWWPGTFSMAPGPGGGSTWTNSVFNVRNTLGNPNSIDRVREERKADYRFRIKQGLNFMAMCVFARDVKLGTRSVVPGQPHNIGGPNNTAYHGRRQNCVHAVSYCLHAGNPPVPVPFGKILTPDDLKRYCRDLVQNIKREHGNDAAEENKGTGWA